jgi:hypothetical protein
MKNVTLVFHHFDGKNYKTQGEEFIATEKQYKKVVSGVAGTYDSCARLRTSDLNVLRDLRASILGAGSYSMFSLEENLPFFREAVIKTLEERTELLRKILETLEVSLAAAKM